MLREQCSSCAQKTHNTNTSLAAAPVIRHLEKTQTERHLLRQGSGQLSCSSSRLSRKGWLSMHPETGAALARRELLTGPCVSAVPGTCLPCQKQGRAVPDHKGLSGSEKSPLQTLCQLQRGAPGLGPAVAGAVRAGGNHTLRPDVNLL